MDNPLLVTIDVVNIFLLGIQVMQTLLYLHAISKGQKID